LDALESLVVGLSDQKAWGREGGAWGPGGDGHSKSLWAIHWNLHLTQEIA